MYAHSQPGNGQQRTLALYPLSYAGTLFPRQDSNLRPPDPQSKEPLSSPPAADFKLRTHSNLLAGELQRRARLGAVLLAVPGASRLRPRPAGSAPRQGSPTLRVVTVVRSISSLSPPANLPRRDRHTAALRARAIPPAPSFRNLVREHAATDTDFRPGGFEPPRLAAYQK
jgi:hypothetical protein